MKAAIYARVSTSHHDQNPQLQIKRLKDFVNSKNWILEKEIVDHGVSGATDKRRGLNELLELARNKKIDAIVITKFDRLFRSLKMLLSTLEELNKLGITFVAMDDNCDYSTSSGRLMLQILGSLAEFYNALLKERTIQGLKYARDVKGIRLGSPEQFNPDVIKKLGDQGMSYQDIAKLLGCSKSTVGRHLRRRVQKWQGKV